MNPNADAQGFRRRCCPRRMCRRIGRQPVIFVSHATMTAQVAVICPPPVTGSSGRRRLPPNSSSELGRLAAKRREGRSFGDARNPDWVSPVRHQFLVIGVRGACAVSQRLGCHRSAISDTSGRLARCACKPSLPADVCVFWQRSSWLGQRSGSRFVARMSVSGWQRSSIKSCFLVSSSRCLQNAVDVGAGNRRAASVRPRQTAGGIGVAPSNVFATGVNLAATRFSVICRCGHPRHPSR